MTSIRWFSPNRFGTLVVPRLRQGGFRIALDGDQPAKIAFASDPQFATEAFAFARRHRAKCVVYLWDLPPWRVGRGKPDFAFEWRGEVRSVTRLVGRYPSRPGFYSRLAFVAQRADAVWVASAATAADVLAYYGISARQIPYCYDSDRFMPGPWQPVTPLRIVSISRLVAHKNHAALIRVAATISPRPVIHLLGEGPEAPRLAALGEQLGVTVEIPGTLASEDQVGAAYRAASLVVAPSRFEGFGLTPMEAWAMGIPVVASDISPHREFLGDRVTYFALDDDASLRGAIHAAVERGPAPPPLPIDLSIGAAADRFAAAFSALIANR